MVQCLQRYDWVKLLRSHLPEGKGVMGAWAKLASRAAFRKGNAYYCGFSNPVEPGMWAGGVVGLKSILGAKKRHQALQTMERLQELGLISYELDPATKKLTYQILDWVVKCSGAECMDGAVYTTDGYGFLCLPRNITQRLAAINYQFDEDRIIRNLEVGNPIICIMGPGDFTTSGHYIVMTGYVDGKIKVNDPNSPTKSEKLWDYDEIKDQIRNLWVCR